MLVLGALVLAGVGSPAAAQEAPEVQEREAFRVCAPPNNLPFSSREERGFENKVAQLFAEDLGLSIEYTWLPQKMGFGRNTLTKYLPEKGRYRCDVVMSATEGFEVGQTTEPWYRSTYVIVYRKGISDEPLKTPQDFLNLPEETLSSLQIGVFTKSPGATWLVDNQLMQQSTSYKIDSGNWQDYPGQVIAKGMARGEVDAAIVWGPIGGYYTKRLADCSDCKNTDFGLIPLNGEKKYPFVFPISMAVRYSDDGLKDTLNRLMQEHKAEIDRILAEYNVPIVSDDGEVHWGD
ncbi:quinoprotein dehydrogenase-associated putative ABC transporter substrate-binding protein [Thiohalorhabdus sp. Cl-TMA]|uniref:Quinoprotein dehydrogenase-associated putative ABC transporter substrate-binding protein n=2 Tax=Thiohalorhabdus methylotrophus TaxID=3242694 RepID=A0ABV4TWW9_9GAMM